MRVVELARAPISAFWPIIYKLTCILDIFSSFISSRHEAYHTVFIYLKLVHEDSYNNNHEKNI